MCDLHWMVEFLSAVSDVINSLELNDRFLVVKKRNGCFAEVEGEPVISTTILVSMEWIYKEKKLYF